MMMMMMMMNIGQFLINCEEGTVQVKSGGGATLGPRQMWGKSANLEVHVQSSLFYFTKLTLRRFQNDVLTVGI